MTKRILLALAIGFVGLFIALGLMRWGGPPLLSAQVATCDFLMVHASGPRLGARPVDDQLVLVLFDYKSANKLGYVHSYEDDVKVYRKLIEAQAEVVYDSRMIATATEEAFEEVRPMLDEMLEINDSGRLMRDVWLSTALQSETEGKYESLITSNILNSHPHAFPFIESRLYPLVHFAAAQPVETAPLTLSRRIEKRTKATRDEIAAELRRSGIMSVWHQLSPELVPKTDIAPSPYRLGDRQIDWHPFTASTSLVPPAAFWVSYDPPANRYVRHSFVDVLEKAEPKDFKGKCVIIGFSAEIDPTSDTYAIPCLSGKASAAEVIASATQTILDGRTMKQLPQWSTSLMLGIFILGLSILASLLRPIQAVIATLVALVAYYGFAVGLYRFGWYPDTLVLPVVASLTAVAGGVSHAWVSLRMRQRVLDLFGRYVPRAVVDQLMRRSALESLTLGGVKREVTVLFADIRGFTTYSQNLPPEEVVKQLNALLEIMVSCTFENEGTLDKFIGDAILVLFNAPLDQPDHTKRAVRTAVTIQQRLAGHQSGLHVGIGVHRGEAVVGNIGTPQRMEYTAIGSTVNIASRLCDFAKPGDVVISKEVLERLDDFAEHFETEPLGSIQVKGITQPLDVSRVISQVV